MKNRNISLMCAAHFVWGFSFFIPIIALYLNQYLDVQHVALLFSVEAIMLVLFEVPTGAIADLFGRKRTLILAEFSAMIAIFFLFFGRGWWFFVLFAVFNSLGRSLISGSDTAIIYDTLKEQGKEKQFKKIIGIYRALWPLGAMLGAIIAGYLANISLKLAVGATIVPYVIALIIKLFLVEPKYEKEKHKNVFLHMLRSSKMIIHSKQIFLIMLGGLLIYAFSETIHRMGSLFFEFKALPLIYFGYAAAALFGLSSLGAFSSHAISEKFGNKFTIVVSVIATPILIILSTFFSKFIAVILFILPSVFWGIRNPVMILMLNSEVESKKRATVLSLQNFMSHLGVAIFAPILGLIALGYDINIGFRVAGICMFIAPAIFMLLKDKK
jgi:MFS family permease